MKSRIFSLLIYIGMTIIIAIAIFSIVNNLYLTPVYDNHTDTKPVIITDVTDSVPDNISIVNDNTCMYTRAKCIPPEKKLLAIKGGYKYTNGPPVKLLTNSNTESNVLLNHPFTERMFRSGSQLVSQKLIANGNTKSLIAWFESGKSPLSTRSLNAFVSNIKTEVDEACDLIYTGEYDGVAVRNNNNVQLNVSRSYDVDNDFTPSFEFFV